MTYRIAEDLAVGRAAPRPRHGLIGDAPADADEVLATVRVLPRWIGLVFALGVSVALWAIIIVAAGWVFRALL